MNYEAFQRYDLNLFGRLIIPHEGGTYFFLDAGYSYELFGCGIVFYIVILAMYSYMHYYACKTDNKPLFIWLTTLMVFGIVGDIWVGISYTAIILGFFIIDEPKIESSRDSYFGGIIYGFRPKTIMRNKNCYI